METLDHEKFEAVKELAEISKLISAGTASLTALQDTTDEYIREREEKLLERLAQALVDSKSMLSEIENNHSALVGYKTELTEFHQSVLSLIQGVNQCKNNLDSAMRDHEDQVTLHGQAVQSFNEASKRERALLDGQRNELRMESEQFGREKVLFEDRKAMFERNQVRNKN